MFTGIIKGIGTVTKKQELLGLTKFSISLPNSLSQNLELGASIAINGVCLTITYIENVPEQATVLFDVIQETLNLTNLNSLQENDLVNVERSAKFGDEIGGHLLSGHVFGTGILINIEKSANNCIFTLKCKPEISKYLFKKGYVAIDGASLTIVEVDKKESTFTVHLIPETLRATTFKDKKINDNLNIEIDNQTQIIVDTLFDKML